MKRLIIPAILAAFTSLTITAQQALWGQAAVKSPEIHPDKTVTFRLLAPGAREVGVTGDFLAPNKVETLRRDSAGMWTWTTPESLFPELYSYSFMVDGLKVNDPSNVFRIRDVATVTDVFLIDGGYAADYAVRPVPHGSVSKVWYDSEVLGIPRRLTVYTPAGYEADTARRYPVFYLLHGMGGDENAWTELGRAAQILDNLIARGDAEPMIVVMTNGNAALEAAPGETSAGLVQPTIQLPKTMDGSFETHFPEVVGFIDSRYRTVPDKAHRAIAGLSMGGFHAMQISKEYPEMFDYVGLFSAAVKPREDCDSPVYRDIERKIGAQFADRPALYWIAIGENDFLYRDNQEYRRLLDSKCYPYIYRESPDGHIWKNWRIYLREFLPQLFRR